MYRPFYSGKPFAQSSPQLSSTARTQSALLRFSSRLSITR